MLCRLFLCKLHNEVVGNFGHMRAIGPARFGLYCLQAKVLSDGQVKSSQKKKHIEQQLYFSQQDWDPLNKEL